MFSSFSIFRVSLIRAWKKADATHAKHDKKKMEEEEEQPTSPHPGPEAFSLKMLVDSRNAGAVLGTRARLYRRFPFFSFRIKRKV